VTKTGIVNCNEYLTVVQYAVSSGSVLDTHTNVHLLLTQQQYAILTVNLNAYRLLLRIGALPTRLKVSPIFMFLCHEPILYTLFYEKLVLTQN